MRWTQAAGRGRCLLRVCGLLVAAWCVISLNASEIVLAEDYNGVDALCANALDRPSRPDKLRQLQRCNEALQSLKQASTTGARDAKLSARLTIAGALIRAIEADAAKEQLNLLRLYPRLLRLIGEVSGDSESSSSTRSLGRVQEAIWSMLLATADQRESGRIGVTMKSGEALIYQTFLESDKTVRVVELTGDPKTKQAEWRESEPKEVQASFARALVKATSPVGRASDKSPRFALLLGGTFSEISLRDEKSLRVKAEDLPLAGLVPVAVKRDERPRPFTLLPAVSGPAPDQDNERKTVDLILLPHGIRAGRWAFPAAFDADATFKSASAIAGAIAQSMRLSLSKSKLDDHQPTALHANRRTMFTVAAPVRVVAAESDAHTIIRPDDVLQESTTLDEWSTVLFEGDFVWIRTALLTRIDERPKSKASASDSAVQPQFITSADVNLREEATEKSRALGIVPKGTSLIVTEERDGWAYTEHQNKKGWVSRNYLRLQSGEQASERD